MREIEPFGENVEGLSHCGDKSYIVEHAVQTHDFEDPPPRRVICPRPIPDVVRDVQGLQMTTTTSLDSMRLVAASLLLQVASILICGCDRASQPPASAPVGAAHERDLSTVHYTDIPQSVQIIGKLGQPLGHLVTVRGKWTTPASSKPALPDFVVNRLNDRLLDSAAEFDQVEPVWKKDEEFARRTVGEEWELRGVETGGFEGFSDEVWEQTGLQPAQHAPRGFLTRFCYVKAERVSGSKTAGNGEE